MDGIDDGDKVGKLSLIEEIGLKKGERRKKNVEERR